MITVDLLADIQLKNPHTGYLPKLSSIKHGFSWNMDTLSYVHPGKYSENEISNNINNFLKSLSMSSFDMAISMVPEHSDRIVDINQENYSTLPTNPYNQNKGYYIESDCCFITVANVPLIFKPADCYISIIKAKDQNNNDILGMIHTGTKGVDLMLATKAIHHLFTNYGCNLNEVIVGICPGISADNYYLDHINALKNPSQWSNFVEEKKGKYYLDLQGLLIKQFIDAGIPQTNIQAYAINTYTASQQGKLFSHLYARESQTAEGRFLVTAQL
jgi:copper oxidase (laccase) domain-containing protein